MSIEKESLQKRVTQIEQEQEQLRLLKLSNKSIPLAVIISILIPIGGYIYTGRWKAFFIMFGSVLFLNLLINSGSKNEREMIENSFIFGGVVFTIIAPIDNALAIRRAKEKMEERS